MNISSLNMNDTNYYPSKKLKNLNFKQVYILKSPEMAEVLKNKSNFKKVKNMAEMLKNASSKFFDSYIRCDSSQNINFFIKFKDNFKWPWNNSNGIYTSPSCNYEIGKLNVPNNAVSRENPIYFSYKDDSHNDHTCQVKPIFMFASKHHKRFYIENDEQPNVLTTEDAVKLDEILQMMAKGEVYGENEGFSYKLKYHPLSKNEKLTKADMKYNKAAREKAIITSEKEIDSLLNKYGTETV